MIIQNRLHLGVLMIQAPGGPVLEQKILVNEFHKSSVSRGHARLPDARLAPGFRQEERPDVAFEEVVGDVS